MGHAHLPNGKLKYYWFGRDPSWVWQDEVEGVNGVRNQLLDMIPDGESILDIGCGSGHLSEVFKRAGRNNPYTGIDNDTETISNAKSLFPNVKFEVADAHFLPYPDKSFDNCVLFGVLECCPAFRKPLDEAARVARKRVIIANNTPLTTDKSYNTERTNNLGNYIVSFNRNKFLNYLASFGFISSKLLEKFGSVQYYLWVVEKYSALARYFHWWPTLARLLTRHFTG